MKKKLYEKPSMKVFELKQKPQLLTGSDSTVRVARSDYGENVVLQDWE